MTMVVLLVRVKMKFEYTVEGCASAIACLESKNQVLRGLDGWVIVGMANRLWEKLN